LFESLTEKLESIFKKLKGKGLLKEEDVEVALKEIRLALLEADVNFKVVKDFVQKIREKAVGKEVLESLTPGQQVIKIVNDELCELLGKTNSKIPLAPNPPTIIMMVGLHGSGKTTTSAKLARLFKKEGRRPLLVAADLQRPAAIDQLITLGSQIDVPVFHSRDEKNPVTLCIDSVKRSKLDGRDIIILDTAGRLHTKVNLMEELKKVKRIMGREFPGSPHEVLLVLDATTGQNAVSQAKMFNEAVGVTGLVLTKLDGTAKGGIIIRLAKEFDIPIRYIGIGEKMDDLRVFNSTEFVDALME